MYRLWIVTSISHPNTPGNAFTAQKAVHYLKGQLLDFGIYSFEWPQDLDSGIDVVAFATLRHGDPDKDDLATAFIAGFQSKGTKDSFGENSKRSVVAGNHADYWMNASLPVFLVAVDVTSGKTLVEDVGSTRDIHRLMLRHNIELNSIPTDISLEKAATDIRLRMFAHALAPWVSVRLRTRSLAHTDHERGLNVQSPWSLLDYIAGPDSSFPIPGSWDEIRQYYSLLDYMLQDAEFGQQLTEDLRVGLSTETFATLNKISDEIYTDDVEYSLTDRRRLKKKNIEGAQVAALRLLAGSIELFTRFPSKEPAKKTLHLTERIAQRIFPKKESEGLRDKAGSGVEKQKVSKKDTSKEEIIRDTMKSTDFENLRFGLLREDLDASIEIILKFWDQSAMSQNLTVSQLAQKISELSSHLSTSPKSSEILGAVADRSTTLQAGLRRSVLEWASKELFIDHWTDVIGSAHLRPKPHGDSLNPDPTFRSYSDHLDEQKNNK